MTENNKLRDRALARGKPVLYCLRCEHKWVPIKAVKKVELCPRCKTPLWHTERTNRQGMRPETEARP